MANIPINIDDAFGKALQIGGLPGGQNPGFSITSLLNEIGGGGGDFTSILISASVASGNLLTVKNNNSTVANIDYQGNLTATTASITGSSSSALAVTGGATIGGLLNVGGYTGTIGAAYASISYDSSANSTLINSSAFGANMWLNVDSSLLINTGTTVASGNIVTVENNSSPVFTVNYQGNITGGSINGHVYPPPVYLITDDANVLLHVNAADLYYGTFKDGSAATEHGTVKFNANLSPRPGVGTFSSSNYYTWPNGTPNIGTGTFTFCALVKGTSFSSDPVIWANGVYGTGGYYAQMGSTIQGLVGGLNGEQEVTVTATASTSSLNVFCGGFDGSSMWVALNGVSNSNSAPTPTASLASTYLGIYADASSYPLSTGQIVEFYVTTTAPTAANLLALYNAVVGNE